MMKNYLISGQVDTYRLKVKLFAFTLLKIYIQKRGNIITLLTFISYRNKTKNEQKVKSKRVISLFNIAVII